jgi:hypothetical protein
MSSCLVPDSFTTCIPSFACSSAEGITPTLLQFEDENRRVYLQPAEGEPQRVELAEGDSLIVTMEPN